MNKHLKILQDEPKKSNINGVTGWLDRWMNTVADLAWLKNTNPMLDAVIDEVKKRQIRIGNKWLIDFASCNYLGLDLDQEIISAIPSYLQKWGTHPSWSRLLGSPIIYEEIEEEMNQLLKCEDTLLFPTITLIHNAIIPLLAGEGAVFLDKRAHKTIYDGCATAAGKGALLIRFPHNDLNELEKQLKACDRFPRIIAIDGVNSMTGNYPDIPSFAKLAREHDALLYVDDAHGFGVIGERGPGELCEYGKYGNSLIRYFNESYENIIFVGGFSKSYSSLLAFISMPTKLKNVLKIAAPPYLYSGPSPIASLASTLLGLKVNKKRGEQLRLRLYKMTKRVLEELKKLGIYTLNKSGFPVIEIPLEDGHDIGKVGKFLFDKGIYVTLAAYPLVPKSEVGFRIQVTAANTEEEIDHLIETLQCLDEHMKIRHVA